MTDSIPLDDVTELSQNIDVFDNLKLRLSTLQQHFVPRGKVGWATDRSRTLDIAELYRIAAFIYLKRAFRRKSSSAMVKHQLAKALDVLERLKVCTAPWTLLIIAREAQTDEERVAILESSENSKKLRKPGKISWNRNMVRDVWEQDDSFTSIDANKVLAAIVEVWIRHGRG